MMRSCLSNYIASEVQNVVSMQIIWNLLVWKLGHNRNDLPLKVGHEHLIFSSRSFLIECHFIGDEGAIKKHWTQQLTGCSGSLLIFANRAFARFPNLEELIENK